MTASTLTASTSSPSTSTSTSTRPRGATCRPRRFQLAYQPLPLALPIFDDGEVG